MYTFYTYIIHRSFVSRVNCLDSSTRVIAAVARLRLGCCGIPHDATIVMNEEQLYAYIKVLRETRWSDNAIGYLTSVWLHMSGVNILYPIFTVD